MDIAELSRRTKEQDVQVEEDAEEHDDQDDEDDEDTEEDEEDKGDGGNHATVVADINETNPQGERNVLEKDKAHEAGEDEDEGGGDDRDDKKKRRTPNTCLPQANQRSMRLSRKANLAEKAKSKKQTDNEKTKKPCHKRRNQILPLRRRAASIRPPSRDTTSKAKAIELHNNGSQGQRYTP